MLNIFDLFGNVFFSLPALIILILDIVALRSIWRGGFSGDLGKILWSLGVIFFPLLGMVLWFLIGKKG